MIGDWGLGIGDCPIPNPHQKSLNNNKFTSIKNNK